MNSKAVAVGLDTPSAESNDRLPWMIARSLRSTMPSALVEIVIESFNSEQDVNSGTLLTTFVVAWTE